MATARAPYELDQREVADTARKLFEGRVPHFQRLAPVFGTAGIRTRQAVKPVDWYLQPRDWPQRMAAYREGALDLFVEAASGALAEAGLSAAEADVIVTVSSTGIATPSLEALAMQRLGFRPDAARIPVFGLGCAGGATGLGIAARLAAGTPGATVLLVAVEVCTTAFRTDRIEKADVVATALFGDGAAACVLRAETEGFAEVRSCSEHTWPGTLDVMGWRIDPEGLGVIFAQSIPSFARARLRPAMDAMLERQALEVADVDRFICHPGGMKVIQALEGALELRQGDLDHEREVLADHGNMSSPTVLHVLDRARRSGLPPCAVVTALGPGFTCSTVRLAA